MSITLAVRPTIVDRVLPRGLVTDIALIFGAAALTALAAQVSIPTALGVPFTLQTFAVLLAGATLGSVRGALSMIVYALAGVIGLPVFADASHGVDVIFGATGGFIIGFIVAAAAIGLIAFTLGTFMYQDKTGPTYPLEGRVATARGEVSDFSRNLSQ